MKRWVFRQKVFIGFFGGLLFGGFFASSWFDTGMSSGINGGIHSVASVVSAILRTDTAVPIATVYPSAPRMIRVVLVPGHEPNDGGARFNALYERDITVELAEQIADILSADAKYQVFITRDTTAWNPIFESYFLNNAQSIASWVNLSRATQQNSQLQQGVPPVLHNDTPTDVALRLYGITKWANENNVDIVLHVHLNDYPGRPKKLPGKYSGFVMYAPSQSFDNGSTTHAIASAVFNRLSLYNPVSSLPVESSGFIDDPELIAVGAYNTSRVASMLIEYEYLYQPQIVDTTVRPVALRDLAYETYLGLEDFFAEKVATSSRDRYVPSVVYHWTATTTDTKSDGRDIYAVQTALMLAGAYPPKEKSLNECPHSGTFGVCTKAALSTFQKQQKISGEVGFVGPKTSAALRVVYR